MTICSCSNDDGTRRSWFYFCSLTCFIVVTITTLGGLTLFNDQRTLVHILHSQSRIWNNRNIDINVTTAYVATLHHDKSIHDAFNVIAQPKENNQTFFISGANDELVLSYNSTFQSPVVLDLFPWELQSMHEYNNISHPKHGYRSIPVCLPPKGIPEACCLGSVSTRGSMVRDGTGACFKGESVYSNVTRAALQELQRTANLVKKSSEKCDVCRIMNIIYQHDLKFALSGDSMMLQTFTGLWCELSRRGYHITENTTYYSMHAMHIGIRGVTILEVTGPSHWIKPVYVTFLSQYKPKEDMSEIREIASTYDVLVMNFGIHWPWKQRRFNYFKTMGNVFNATVSGSTLQLLAYRETSAQHFNGPAGEWQDGSILFPCHPWLEGSQTSRQFGWRERAVQETATTAGYKLLVADETLPSHTTGHETDKNKELVILPFYNYTVSMYFLHPNECTHYCSTPFLWMPVWRSLRLAMDRKWAT